MNKTKNGIQADLGSCRYFKPRSTTDKSELAMFLARTLITADVKRYVMFLSTGRSGHSWIGSVLDAAPNALVANEYGAFKKFRNERRQMTQDSLFEGLAKNSFICGKYGRIQVYDYSIPGLWQGKIGNGQVIDVIGDKMGGSTVEVLRSFGDPWEDKGAPEAQQKFIQEFRDMVKVPLRAVVVLRNPFNMIATNHLRGGWKGKEIPSSSVQMELNKYRQIIWASENLFEPGEVHTMTMESFATNTETEMILLCEFVGIRCPPNMFQIVNNLTNHTPHDTYMLAQWEEEQVIVVNDFIEKHLSEYGYRPVSNWVTNEK